MSQQDRLEIEKTESKNNLEEYVYEIRDKISSTIEQFISEEVILVSMTTIKHIYNLYKTRYAITTVLC